MFDHEAVDPRSKLALATTVSIAAIATAEPVELVALLGVTVALVALGSGFGVRRWIDTLRPLSLLLPALLFVNTLFYVGGRSVFATRVAGYRVGVTTGGIETAAVIALRLLAIAGVAAWFAATTSAERFEAGLVRLGVPWSVAFLLSLSVRLVPEMR
ncbi:MAG: energy-coupling factor transporter transmembrane component T, partial [Halanaeroarchaeum sp.]